MIEDVVHIVLIGDLGTQKRFVETARTSLVLASGKYGQCPNVHPVPIVYPVPVLQHPVRETMATPALDLNVQQDPFLRAVPQKSLDQHVHEAVAAAVFKFGEQFPELLVQKLKTPVHVKQVVGLVKIETQQIGKGLFKDTFQEHIVLDRKSVV